MIFHVIAIEIRIQLYFLPNAHVLHLALFKVGIHPHFIQRHDGKQRGAGGDTHPELHSTFSDVTTDGRNNGAAGVIEIALAQRRNGGFDFRMVIHHGVINHRLIGFERLLCSQ